MDTPFKKALTDKGIREARIPVSTTFEDYDDLRRYAHGLLSNTPDMEPMTLFQKLSLYSRDHFPANPQTNPMDKNLQLPSTLSTEQEKQTAYFDFDGIACELVHDAAKESFEITFPEMMITEESRQHGIVDKTLVLHTNDRTQADGYVQQVRSMIADAGPTRNIYTIFLHMQRQIQEKYNAN